MKHSLVVSHPGTDVPWGILTDTFSANTGGKPRIIKITKNPTTGKNLVICKFNKLRTISKNKRLIVITNIVSKD